MVLFVPDETCLLCTQKQRNLAPSYISGLSREVAKTQLLNQITYDHVICNIYDDGEGRKIGGFSRGRGL